MKYLKKYEWFFNKAKKLDWLRGLSKDDFPGWEFEYKDKSYYFDNNFSNPKKKIDIELTSEYARIRFSGLLNFVRFHQDTVYVKSGYDRKYVEK